MGSGIPQVWIFLSGFGIGLVLVSFPSVIPIVTRFLMPTSKDLYDEKDTY